MKIFSSLLLSIFFISQNSYANLKIEIPDVDSKIMRVKYTLKHSIKNSKEYIFPRVGYEFTKTSIKVISIIEENTGHRFDHKVIAAPDNVSNEAVKIIFPNPMSTDAIYNFSITVEAETNQISKDTNGHYVFKYTTSSRKVFFKIPKGHTIVYSNFPVVIHENNGEIVVEVQGSDDSKNIVFKTKASCIN